MNILGLLAVVIPLLILAVGLFLSYTELGIFSDYVVISGVETAGVTKVNTRAIRSLLALVPSKTKSDIVEIKFIPHMPDTYDEMHAVSKGTVLGKNGIGAGCGKPKRSLMGLKTEIPIYLTGEKIINQMGMSEAERQLNLLVKMCLVWSQWTPAASPNDFNRLTDEPYVYVDETKIVEL